MTPTKGKEVHDIMYRTMTNLRFIQEQKLAGADVFEVTQLINSFLGALAHPWEKYETELNRWSLTDQRYAQWRAIKNALPEGHDPPSVGKLIGKLRNAFTHGNIEFQSDSKGEIERITLWNVPTGKKVRNWEAIIAVPNLREILNNFEALEKNFP